MKEYYKERAETYKRIAEDLWQVLDDIDTLSDIIKPMGIYGFEEFYRGTMKKVKRRNDMLQLHPDGHTLYYNIHKLPPRIEIMYDDEVDFKNKRGFLGKWWWMKWFKGKGDE